MQYQTVPVAQPQQVQPQAQPQQVQQVLPQQVATVPQFQQAQPQQQRPPRQGTEFRSRNVYFGKLPLDFSEQDLRNLCERFGQVLSVKLSTSKDGSSCFGFTLFANDDLALRAIRTLNGSALPNGGKSIEVRTASASATSSMARRRPNEAPQQPAAFVAGTAPAYVAQQPQFVQPQYVQPQQIVYNHQGQPILTQPQMMPFMQQPGQPMMMYPQQPQFVQSPVQQMTPVPQQQAVAPVQAAGSPVPAANPLSNGTPVSLPTTTGNIVNLIGSTNDPADDSTFSLNECSTSRGDEVSFSGNIHSSLNMFGAGLSHSNPVLPQGMAMPAQPAMVSVPANVAQVPAVGTAVSPMAN